MNVGELIRALEAYPREQVVGIRSDKDKGWIREVKRTETRDLPISKGSPQTVRFTVIVH